MYLIQKRPEFRLAAIAIRFSTKVERRRCRSKGLCESTSMGQWTLWEHKCLYLSILMNCVYPHSSEMRVWGTGWIGQPKIKLFRFTAPGGGAPSNGSRRIYSRNPLSTPTHSSRIPLSSEFASHGGPEQSICLDNRWQPKTIT